MTYSVQSKWIHKMAFSSQIDQHQVRMDTTGLVGDDSGPSPKKLLLAALAGCTGMDVVALLKKMRVSFDNLIIDIEADLTQEHPRVFSVIRINYRIYGHQLKENKIKKAIDLSQVKYCGVSAMLKKNSPIHYTIEYISSGETT